MQAYNWFSRFYKKKEEKKSKKKEMGKKEEEEAHTHTDIYCFLSIYLLANVTQQNSASFQAWFSNCKSFRLIV